MAKAQHTTKGEKSLTRAKSEKLIASFDRVKDLEALEAFTKHANKRLAKKATYKLANAPKAN